MINTNNYVNEDWTQWKMAIDTWSSVQNYNNCGSGSGKTNALIHLINEQNDIDKIYLYAIDLSKPKYEYLI